MDKRVSVTINSWTIEIHWSKLKLYLPIYKANLRGINMTNHSKIWTAPILLVALSLGSALACAESGGWFSGISALPLSLHVDSGSGFDGGTLSTNIRNDSALARSNAADYANTHSFVLGGSGAVPLNSRWSLTGRLGGVRTTGDVTNNAALHGLADVLPYNQLGFGMKYDISSSLRLQGGWDRYQLTSNRINGDAGVDLLSLGLKYRF